MPKSEIEILRELHEKYEEVNAMLKKRNAELTNLNAALKTAGKSAFAVIANLETQLSLSAKIIETQKTLLANYHAAPNPIADQLRKELDHSRSTLGAVIETAQTQLEKRKKAEQVIQQQNTAIENLRQKVEEQKDSERRGKFEKKPQQ